MYEKVTWVEVEDAKYPLLYNLVIAIASEERYGPDISILDYVRGPVDEDGDSDAVKADKKKERDAAGIRIKKELPWLISGMAEQGIALLKEQGEKPDVKAPTEKYVLAHIRMPQVPGAITGVLNAVADAYATEHIKGENEEVDIALEELESKNA